MESFTPGQLQRVGEFVVGFDANTGAVDHLRHAATGRLWADKRHRLGSLLYETFSRADYDRYYQDYIINKRETGFWAIHDFTKTYMPDWVKHLQIHPRMQQGFVGRDGHGMRYVFSLSCSGEAVEVYGCPREFWIEYRFPDEGSKISCTLQWFGKSATRIAEAVWFSFNPCLRSPQDWYLDKLGQPVSLLEVIRNGNRRLHAVGEGVSYRGEEGELVLRSLDAALVAPGDRSLVNFNNQLPDLKHGMHFLLYNNTWCTNFPMWYEEDARFRFEIDLHPASA